MASTHTFDRREEIANAVTHGIGALLSVAALVLLIVFSSIKGTAWHVVSFTIYGASMLLLYLCSTLVHSFKEGKAKDLFEFLDHSSIYIFIAGTYTPFLLVVLRGPLGWSLFGTVWGLPCSASCLKLFRKKIPVFVDGILPHYGLADRDCVGAVNGGCRVPGHRFARYGRRFVHAGHRVLRLAGISVPPCDLASVRAGRERYSFFAILLYLLPHH